MSLDLGTLVGYLELDDDRFTSTIDAFPGTLGKYGTLAGSAAAGAMALVAASLLDGISQGMEVGDVVASAGADLGLSQADAERVGASAGRLYAANYGESITETGDAVTQVLGSIDGMRQASDTAVEGMAAKVLGLSDAFGVDTARTTQLVGQLLRSGLVRDAEEGVDLVAAAMQLVPEAVREDVLDAADEYGPFFQSLGLSGSEAMGLLVDAAGRGTYGIDKTGDALKELSIRASDLGDSGAQQALADLGLSGTDTANLLLAGGDTARGALDSIVDGLLSIPDPAAQAASATALFGTPLEDLGTGGIPSFLSSLDTAGSALGDVAGTAASVGASLQGSPRASWEKVSRTWDAITGQVGVALVPLLQAVTDTLNENPTLLQLVAGAVGLLAAGFVALTVAVQLQAVATAANPLTWVIVGAAVLLGVILALVAGWDQLSAFLGGAWAGFVGWFTEVMDGFLGWWDGIWSGLMGGIAAGWEGIIAWAQSIPAMLAAFVAGVGDWLLEAGRLLLSGLATGLALGIMFVVWYFTELPGLVLGWLAGAGEWLLQAGVDLLTGLGLGIIAGWNAVVSWFTALPDVLWGLLVSASVWLVIAGMDLLLGLGQGISDGWGGLVSWFTALPFVVAAFLSTAGSWLVSTGASAIGGLESGVRSGWTGFVAWLQGIPGWVVGLLASSGSWLVSMGSDLMTGLLSGAASLADSIGAYFLDLLPSWIVAPFKAAMGIHSPSRVFHEFGRNIAQGIPLGAEDEQSELDARMRQMVVMPGKAATRRHATEVRRQRRQGNVVAGPWVSDSQVVIHGNVGWSVEELEQEFGVA